MNRTGAVVYVRVSDESQAETDTDGGYSLGVQKQMARLHASELGADFTKVYSEPGHTATKMRRPELDAAIERAKQDDISWFIVHKINRFARNTMDGLRIEQELKDHGVALVSVAEKWDDTPAGRLIKTMYFALAEMYSAELSEEVTTKMAEKARRGGTPGRAPLGYTNVRKDVDGMKNVARIEIDDERASHIEWAFEEFAKGHYTLSSMRDALEDRGLTTRATKRYPERPLSRSALAKLLRNSYYIGIVSWGGNQYKGKHPTLVDEDTFQRAQDVLDNNNTAGDKSWRYKQYLKGTLRCGFCQSRLGFVHGRGDGGVYEYFYCLGRQRKNGCPQRYIPVWQAEAAVERHYANIIQQQANERLPAVQSAFRELLDGFNEHSETEARRQRARLAKLERQQRKLLDLAYEGRCRTILRNPR